VDYFRYWINLMSGILQGFVASLGGSSGGQQAYTTPGTYSFVVPAGVSTICAVAIGGGGSGGGGDPSYYGGGGAGGGLSYGNDIAVTSGETLAVVVGAGGASFSSSASQRDGNNGQSSTLIRSVPVI
jgi:hypothetical protein